MREIKVTVNADGTTKTDFSGYQGATCLDAAEQLRQLLAAYGIQTSQTNFIAKPELTQALEEPQQTARRNEAQHDG